MERKMSEKGEEGVWFVREKGRRRKEGDRGKGKEIREKGEGAV